MNHQLAGSAASIASSLPLKPSPQPLTFHNPTKQLLLAQLRELRMADTIIFSLIERAQFLHRLHPRVWHSEALCQRPATPDLRCATPSASPPLCGSTRRPRTCLLSWALTGAPLSHALHPTCTNKTNALYSRPTTYVLPALTAPRADPTYIIAYSTG